MDSIDDALKNKGYSDIRPLDTPIPHTSSEMRVADFDADGLHEKRVVKILVPQKHSLRNILYRGVLNGRVESGSLNDFDHPHFDGIIDSGVVDDVPYLIKRFRGFNLEATCRDEPWPLEKIIQQMKGPVDAIAKANAHGFVHGDIKPANFVQNGSVYVTDTQLFAHEKTIAAEDVSLFGFLPYATPKLINGLLSGENSKPDANSDRHALALTLYFLATGEHMFDYKLIEHEHGRLVHIGSKDYRLAILDGDTLRFEVNMFEHRAILEEKAHSLPKPLRKFILENTASDSKIDSLENSLSHSFEVLENSTRRRQISLEAAKWLGLGAAAILPIAALSALAIKESYADPVPSIQYLVDGSVNDVFKSASPVADHLYFTPEDERLQLSEQEIRLIKKFSLDYGFEPRLAASVVLASKMNGLEHYGVSDVISKSLIPKGAPITQDQFEEMDQLHLHAACLYLQYRHERADSSTEVITKYFVQDDELAASRIEHTRTMAGLYTPPGTNEVVLDARALYETLDNSLHINWEEYPLRVAIPVR